MSDLSARRPRTTLRSAFLKHCDITALVGTADASSLSRLPSIQHNAGRHVAVRLAPCDSTHGRDECHKLLMMRLQALLENLERQARHPDSPLWQSSDSSRALVDMSAGHATPPRSHSSGIVSTGAHASASSSDDSALPHSLRSSIAILSIYLVNALWSVIDCALHCYAYAMPCKLAVPCMMLLPLLMMPRECR